MNKKLLSFVLVFLTTFSFFGNAVPIFASTDGNAVPTFTSTDQSSSLQEEPICSALDGDTVSIDSVTDSDSADVAENAGLTVTNTSFVEYQDNPNHLTEHDEPDHTITIKNTGSTDITNLYIKDCTRALLKDIEGEDCNAEFQIFGTFETGGTLPVTNPILRKDCILNVYEEDFRIKPGEERTFPVAVYRKNHIFPVKTDITDTFVLSANNGGEATLSLSLKLYEPENGITVDFAEYSESADNFYIPTLGEKINSIDFGTFAAGTDAEPVIDFGIKNTTSHLDQITNNYPLIKFSLPEFYGECSSIFDIGAYSGINYSKYYFEDGSDLPYGFKMKFNHLKYLPAGTYEDNLVIKFSPRNVTCNGTIASEKGLIKIPVRFKIVGQNPHSQPVTNLKATSGDGYVKLSWDATNDPNQYYAVFVYNEELDSWNKSDFISRQNWVHYSGLTNGKTYSYRVCAVNDSYLEYYANDAWYYDLSDPVSATPKKDENPLLFSPDLDATFENLNSEEKLTGKYTLSWTLYDHLDNGDGTARVYAFPNWNNTGVTKNIPYGQNTSVAKFNIYCDDEMIGSVPRESCIANPTSYHDTELKCTFPTSYYTWEYEGTLPDTNEPHRIYVTAVDPSGKEGLRSNCELYVGKNPTKTEIPITSFSFDKSTVRLKVGDTCNLQAITCPINSSANEEEIVWNNSNNKAASISVPTDMNLNSYINRTITAKAVGTTVITATASDGTHQAQCTVTVIKKDTTDPDNPTDPVDPEEPDPEDPDDPLPEDPHYPDDFPEDPVDAEDPIPDNPEFEIPDGIWAKNFKTEMAYTGNKLTQNCNVYYGSTLLREKKDYSVSYKNNVNAGTATMTIKGLKKYKGNVTKTFEILPAEIENANIALTITQSKGKASGVKAKVTYYGKTLKQNKDYSLTYDVNDLTPHEGYYNVQVNGIGNFTGHLDKVSVDSNLTSISKGAITGLNPAGYSYTGKDICPLISVRSTKDETGTLLSEDDYEVLYLANRNAGKATITVIGKESKGYTGKITAKFTINKLSVKDCTVNYQHDIAYSKGGAKPIPTVSYQKDDVQITLKEGYDYSLSYKKNGKVDALAPTFTIKGIGNFTDSKEESFSIVKKDINRVKIVVSNIAPNSRKTGKYFFSVPKVYDTDGKELKNKTDYTLVYKRNATGLPIGPNDPVPAGAVIEVDVIGTDVNYAGTKKAYYKVLNSNNLSSVSVEKIADVHYTGKKQTPVPVLYTLNKATSVKTPLTEGTDYEIVGYYNNVRIGTAFILLRGKGDYSGIKLVKYKIIPNSVPLSWKGVLLSNYTIVQSKE